MLAVVLRCPCRPQCALRRRPGSPPPLMSARVGLVWGPVVMGRGLSFFSKIGAMFSKNEKLDGLELYRKGNTLLQSDSPQSKRTAVDLYKQSARLGYPPALYSLATITLQFAKDQAPHWEAEREVFLVDHGAGSRPLEPTRSLRGALECLEYLSKLGLSDASHSLGLIYCKGAYGVEVDRERGIEYWKVATAQGHQISPFELYKVFEGRDKEEAVKWLSIAAERKYIEALFILGNHYNLGIHVQQDLKKAFELYKDAADEGLPVAAHNLACAYLEGRGVERDPLKAVYYFKIGSDKHYAPSTLNLASMYLNGDGISRDLETAKILYTQFLDWNQMTDETRIQIQKILKQIS